MALFAASFRGLAQRVAPTVARSQPSFAPRLAPGLSAWPAANIMAPAASRTYTTAIKYSRADVLEKLDAFHAEVLAANWADYLYLVYNVPFWEAEYEKLIHIVQPYLYEKEVGEKFKQTEEMMDVLYKCEDVRDHLNELAELATRASGFMGTGYAPLEKVENIPEHAKHCIAAYDKLQEEHPTFKPKIEQTVGHGLAILRSKHKFTWPVAHRYFY
mmetsp:Transcript_6515/g.14244  ORF Transcript_6515/g.14244 Transcript_6515/m.14244 type:complete len:215 (-) Transcript_6515:147-791(-)|eukprot:CAMPEP_0178405370 /NCGR_PEP_ID=MMETSP0689_2-20121128/18363_1 /TAXON_ID=160604 /ORGANISM="Amphidinium massartii, Strain CS-259" /LENGTH=214 /DNA_ID=CAMNT_0020026381 /DNA_START=59 /DNA_END=703 /DNA_ORIENTATION=+